MSRKYVVAVIFWSLFLLILPVQGMAQESCRELEPDVCRAVGQLMKQKEQAVHRRKLDLFLQTIDPENTFYRQEQKRWFQDAIQGMDPDSFHLKVLSVMPDRDKTVRSVVEQVYSAKGEPVSVRWPVRLRLTPQGWKESDLAFEQWGDQKITVYYTNPALKMNAQIAYHTLKKAAAKLQKRLAWQPQKMEVKLYHDPEWFRQSVKPSLPRWAGGWHEANQSIKFLAGHTAPDQLASGMIHELAHQAVSDLTNDNAAYWLQEGAAMYYEAHLMPELHVNHQVELLERTWSLADLENTPLEKLPAEKAHQYYLNSYVRYRQLVGQYGEEGIQKLFARLKKFPYIDEESEPKRKQLNQRTRKALSEVFCNGEKNFKKSVDLCRGR
jgi:hypothetical protein